MLSKQFLKNIPTRLPAKGYVLVNYMADDYHDHFCLDRNMLKKELIFSPQQKLLSIPSMGFVLFPTSFLGKMMKHVWSVCRLPNCGNELKKRQRSSRSWRCHGGAVFMTGRDRTGFPNDWRCERQSSAVIVQFLCLLLEKKAILSSNHGTKGFSADLLCFFRGSSLYSFVFICIHEALHVVWFRSSSCEADQESVQHRLKSLEQVRHPQWSIRRHWLRKCRRKS